jgi:hypothetical protein
MWPRLDDGMPPRAGGRLFAKSARRWPRFLLAGEETYRQIEQDASATRFATRLGEQHISILPVNGICVISICQEFS